MPKIDPITGCSVMTMNEFAIAEGYDNAGKMLDEVYKEMDEDSFTQERELYSNPKEVFEIFKTCCQADDDFDFFQPKKHFQTLYVRCSQGFRNSGMVIVAAFRCNDKQIHIGMYSHSYWGGSRMEPPEVDEYAEWF